MIQQTAEIKHISIVMFSANHQLRDILTTSCTPNVFITKPFDLSDLINIIATQLEKVN